MTAADLLAQLDALGAKLVAKPPDGKLVIVARKGTVTPELAALVASHKQELRYHLLKAETLAEDQKNDIPSDGGADIPPATVAIERDALLEEVEKFKQVFETITLDDLPAATPVPLAPVKRLYADGPTLFTLVRHGCGGPNRSGQDAVEFPYAVINYPLWKRDRFDLRLARWYRSREEAFAGGPAQSERKPPEDEEKCTCADFPGGVRVTIQRQAGRWLMFEERYGKQVRRRDFASPFLGHSRMCAEHFYGEPLGEGWRDPDAKKEGKR